ncbi:MAG: hypothetical protein IJW54_07260 [Clostridia bacterium]|nr:hypothetical protein [Clostridia bacterium]
MQQAQHHLTEGQHHFEQSENIIAVFGTNKRCCTCANDVLRNDVMLCINEVALRANGKNASVQIQTRKDEDIFLSALHISMENAHPVLRMPLNY